MIPPPTRIKWIKLPSEIGILRENAAIVGEILSMLQDFIKAGISTAEIADFCLHQIRQRGAEAALLDTSTFPACVCTSVNEEAVHGIPSDRILQTGDLLSVDLVLRKEGFFADGAWTYAVGTISAEKQKLQQAAWQVLWSGMESLQESPFLATMAKSMQDRAAQFDASIIREFVGHGIGRRMHEPPRVPYDTSPDFRERLYSGCVFTLEPVLTLSPNPQTVKAQNGWTLSLANSFPAAQFEFCFLYKKQGIENLTFPGLKKSAFPSFL